MVRKLDELGRIVIPIEIRNELNLQHNTEIEIEQYGEEIILSKYDGITCKECGISISRNDNYCSNCGKRLK